jgi:hypothetical protein
LGKTTILFKEYDTLRAELIARSTHWYQLGGIAIAVIGWLVARPFDKPTIIALPVVMILGAFFAVTLARDVYFLANRLRELEAEINMIAGSELLKWETRYGGTASKSYFWRTHGKRVLRATSIIRLGPL